VTTYPSSISTPLPVPAGVSIKAAEGDIRAKISAALSGAGVGVGVAVGFGVGVGVVKRAVEALSNPLSTKASNKSKAKPATFNLCKLKFFIFPFLTIIEIDLFS
jgi:hypothetical protein